MLNNQGINGLPSALTTALSDINATITPGLLQQANGLLAHLSTAVSNDQFSALQGTAENALNMAKTSLTGAASVAQQLVPATQEVKETLATIPTQITTLKQTLAQNNLTTDQKSVVSDTINNLEQAQKAISQGLNTSKPTQADVDAAKAAFKEAYLAYQLAKSPVDAYFKTIQKFGAEAVAQSNIPTPTQEELDKIEATRLSLRQYAQTVMDMEYALGHN